MNLVISLSVKTVCGTGNGGEDLFLVIRAECDQEPSEDSLGPAFDSAWKNLCVKLAQVKGDDKDEAVWLEDGVFHSNQSSSLYEFRLDWPEKMVLKAVKKVVLCGEWVKVVRAKKLYKVEDKVFVDGNAD